MDLLEIKYLISYISFEGIYRKETLELPKEVLREAIINAIIHRDYIGAHTQLKIYPDKIVLWNEGSLPESLTVSDLKREHPSRPRNELLADIVFKAGLIETWGCGTLKMVNLCKQIGLPEPEFTQEFGGFSITFCKDIYNSENLYKFNINERQKNAIEYMKKNKRINNSTYQKINIISKPTATQDLTDLINKGLITKLGTRGAGTYYILK